MNSDEAPSEFAQFIMRAKSCNDSARKYFELEQYDKAIERVITARFIWIKYCSSLVSVQPDPNRAGDLVNLGLNETAFLQKICNDALELQHIKAENGLLQRFRNYLART